MPPLVGQVVLNDVYVLISSVDMLNDIYVNKTQFVTKHSAASHAWNYTHSNALVFGVTQDPGYVAKRKALSGAFFKTKLMKMTQLIQQVTRASIRKLQTS